MSRLEAEALLCFVLENDDPMSSQHGKIHVYNDLVGSRQGIGEKMTTRRPAPRGGGGGGEKKEEERRRKREKERERYDLKQN
jgi:hypothetical protein